MFGKKKKDPEISRPISPMEERRPADIQELWAAFLDDLSRKEAIDSPIDNDLRRYLSKNRYGSMDGISDMLEQHLPELEQYYKSRAEYIRASAYLYADLLESRRRGTLANEEALYRGLTWRMNELYETTDCQNDAYWGRAITDVQRVRMHLLTDGFYTANDPGKRSIRDLGQACSLFETFYWTVVKYPFLSLLIYANKKYGGDYDRGIFDYVVKLKKELEEDMDRPEDPERWVLLICYQFLVEAMVLMDSFFERLKSGVGSVTGHSMIVLDKVMSSCGVKDRFPEQERQRIAAKGVERAVGMLLPNILEFLVKKEVLAREEADGFRSMKGREALEQGLRYLSTYSDLELENCLNTLDPMRRFRNRS